MTAVCPSQHWVIIGTSTGSLSLWDLRFGLLLKSWRAGGAITSLQLHPSRGKGRWIMVGVERTGEESPVIETFDIETSTLVEVYEVRSSRTTKSVPADPKPPMSRSEVIAAIAKGAEDLNTPFSVEPKVETPSVLSLMVGQSFASVGNEREDASMLMSVPESGSIPNPPGWMVSAGEDRVVRYWDLGKASDGFVLCGSQKEKDVSFRRVAPNGAQLITQTKYQYRSDGLLLDPECPSVW